jgi:hypothetical protein
VRACALGGAEGGGVAACCLLPVPAVGPPACMSSARMHTTAPPCPRTAPAPALPCALPCLECRTEEEDVEVAPDARDLLTKIGVETSLR